MNAQPTLLATKQLVIALVAIAAVSLMIPLQILAQENATQDEDTGGHDKGFIPSRVFLFNEDTEVSTTTERITVASLTYQFAKPHRLTIDYSSVGAITPDSASAPATLFIGCFVDGDPCIGTQDNPSNTPPGWVNALSCNYPQSCAWDSVVSHTWFSKKLTHGKHKVEIKLAVGNPLIPSFLGTGTALNEVRNLVVTVLTDDDSKD